MSPASADGQKQSMDTEVRRALSGGSGDAYVSGSEKLPLAVAERLRS